MSDAVLERRCRRLARVYPDARRAEEVLTTLMESNEGRRAPRAADVFDVLWHALRARLGNRSPGTRLGVWGDAAAVAVVALAVTHAAIAVAVAFRLREHPLPGERLSPFDHLFPSFGAGYAAVVFATLAAYAAGAMAFGLVRLARLSAVLAAAAGGAALVTVARNGHPLSPFEYPVTASIVAFVAVTAAVLGTTAVARAARVVPAWWWGMSAIVTFGVTVWTLNGIGAPFDWSRPGLVAGVALPTAVLGLALLAAPLARSFPHVFCGTLLAALPAMPFAALLVNWSFVFPGARRLDVVAGSVAAWLVLLGLVVVALPSRRRYDAEAPSPDEPA